MYFTIFDVSAVTYLARIGEDVNLIMDGEHSNTYERRLGKTSYVGLPVEAGKIWTAKGKVYIFFNSPTSLHLLKS